MKCVMCDNRGCLYCLIGTMGQYKFSEIPEEEDMGEIARLQEQEKIILRIEADVKLISCKPHKESLLTIIDQCIGQIEKQIGDELYKQYKEGKIRIE